MDPILDAIRFAELAAHQGASYALTIHLAGASEPLTGVTVASVALTDDATVISYRLIGDGEAADLFVNPDLVTHVTIEW